MNEIVEYSETLAGLADLRGRIANVVYDVTTTAGMDLARKDRRECVSLRANLERLRKEKNADDHARIKARNESAEQIEAQILAVENPIDAQIKAQEARKEAERVEKERQEAARALEMQGRLDAIRNLPLDVANRSVDAIEAAIRSCAEFDTAEFVGVFQIQAEAVKIGTATKLDAALVARKAFEAEQLRLAAERAEIAAERARQAEENRKAEEARAELDRAAKAERDRIAAIEAEQRRLERVAQEAAQREQSRIAAEVQAEAERAAAAQRQAEADKLAADRAELAREKAEADRLAKIESNRQAAEAKRLADERKELERKQAEADRAERERQAKVAADALKAAQEAAAEREKREINAASTVEAMTAAHALLVKEGYGARKETKMLAAAIKRESSARKAA